MDKEQVVDKLEKVFEEACIRYINRSDETVTLREIKELGETIISSKESIQRDFDNASKYIDAKIKLKVAEQCDINKIAKELYNLQNSRIKDGI